MKFNPQTSVTELALATNCDATKNDPVSDGGNVDGVYVFATDQLSLGSCGLDSLIPLRKVVMEEEYWSTESFCW